MRHNTFTRAATLAPTTYDAKTRTIEVVLSTGAAVQRYGYVEKLDINGADLRGIVGTPVLDAHNQSSTRAVIGIIQKAWKADGEIRALLKLSSRDDVAGIVRDIAEGIIRNISIGYGVKRWADSTNSKGDRIRTAVAWSIHEASFVPVGADPGAKTRSHSMRKTKKSGAANTPAPQTEADVIDNTPEPETREEPTVAETRAQIRTIMRSAIPNDLTRAAEEADSIIDEDGTVQDAQSRAYEIMQERTSRAPRVRIVGNNDSPQQVMQRRQDGLYARITGTAPTEQGREFVHTRFVDHARAMLAEQHVSTFGMNDFDIIVRAMTTSDLPSLLTGTGNRALMAAYEAVRTPLFATGVQREAPDFRALTNIRASGYPQLQELGGENSEFQNITISEVEDTFRLATVGGILPVSFQALTNDDLGAIPQHAQRGATAVAQWQKRKIIALLEDNAVMSEDNEALFSAAHGNLMTPSRIVTPAGALTPLEDARLALRTQKDLNGVDTLNLTPKYLVVPAELETEAQKVMSLIYAAQVNDANVFASSMELLVESDLSQGWYVFASPAAAPVWQHAWLRGQAGPQFAQQENFRNLSVEFRVHAHWNCGVLPGGWRGAVFNSFTDSSNS